MENNVIVDYDEPFRLIGDYVQFELKNNFITGDDPGFIDQKNLNFQLKDNSIVYKKIPEFKKIPFEKIGLYSDEHRKH